MKPRFIHTAVFLISAVGLAYQVALMRILSIAQWHHAAYMIISAAMLGFGAGGTTLAIGQAWVRGRESGLLRVSVFLLSCSLTACYAAAQIVPFETYQLLTQPAQFRNLFVLYLLYSVPFFLLSVCLVLAFHVAPQRVASLYCANLFGSGLGALGAIGLLYLAHPSRLPHLLSVPAAAAFLLLLRDTRRAPAWAVGCIPLFATLILCCWNTPIRQSEYKGISYALQLPDAAVIGEECSPQSVVTAVSSKHIRETPGQISMTYPMSRLGTLPEQIGLYFDGGSVSPVSRFDGSLEPFAYLDYVVSALPYGLVDRPRVLILGSGGGGDLLGALYHGASHVTAVEADPGVSRTMHSTLRDFSGGLYDRPDVKVVRAEGRGYLQSHDECFDLIHIGLLDSFNTSSAGVLALNESYLYTKEALALYLNRLSQRGILVITRWLDSPPRDALKLLATAVEACEAAGIREPARHLASIRSWNIALVLVSRTPLSEGRIEAVRAFCRERQFDVCYYPGTTRDETNRFTILDDPVLYDFASAVLTGDRQAAYRLYPFYVRPATDDQPYYHRFFKWASLPWLVRALKANAMPIVEWGYIMLVACVIQGTVAGATLILLPFVLGKRSALPPGSRRWTLIGFGGLGLGFMFLEIAFIQRFMLFLAYPMYAVAVVLTAFLVFSGFGSLLASRYRMRPDALIAGAAIGIAIVSTTYLAMLKPVFLALGAWPDAGRIVVSILLLAPLAFCMGIPFPTCLQRLSDTCAPLLPWAWAINGCASVIGASLATLLAIHVGFRALVIIAICTYLLTAACLIRLDRLLQAAETVQR